MDSLIFSFEKEKMPPAVFLATAALIAIFALGLAYRVISFVAF